MAEAKIKTHEKKITKNIAEVNGIFPAGISRFNVRGFFASNFASVIRLKPIAEERALAMATRIQRISFKETGVCRHASMADENAKGNANRVWENLIILK